MTSARFEAIISTPYTKDNSPRPHPRIVCKDGVSLSVQASHFTYCKPRNNIGPWTQVEVGFPSIKPPRSWKQYAEDWSDPTGTVYGWVPVAVVRRFIKQHGGEK